MARNKRLVLLLWLLAVRGCDARFDAKSDSRYKRDKWISSAIEHGFEDKPGSRYNQTKREWMSQVQLEYFIGFALSDYDRTVGPTPMDASKPLVVQIKISLNQLLEVNEKNQIVTTYCRITQMWTDYRIQWVPEYYENFEQIKIPLDEVWTPNIELQNNVDVNVKKDTSSSKVTVSKNGDVKWVSSYILKSPCQINVRHFPFDEQFCTLVFASSTYNAYEVELVNGEDSESTEKYTPHSEWELVKIHANHTKTFYSCCAEPFVTQQYTIQIRRRPLFYVYNLILPCLLITFVALLAFCIPSQSGEKVTMGITTLVSMTVFLLLVNDIIHPTSDALPLISVFYGSMIAIVALTTAMNIFTLNVYYLGQSGKAVPTYMKRLFTKMCPPVCVFSTLRRTLLGRGHPHPGMSDEMHPNLRATEIADGQLAPTAPMVNNEQIKPTAKQSFHPETPIKKRCDLSKTTRLAYIRNNSEEQIVRVMERIANSLDKIDFKVMERIANSLDKMDERQIMDEQKRAVTEEWQEMSLHLDKLLLALFIIITLAITMTIAGRSYFTAH